MTVLASLLRLPLLGLSRSRRARELVLRMPITATVVSRFVAGQTIAECLDAVRRLAAEGLTATIDHLGEDTTSPADAAIIRDTYLALLAELGSAGLADLAEVSVKLSALGLKLPDGHRLALNNAWAICAAAASVGTTVTIDAEDHTTTDAALAILAELRRDYPATGGVVQSYLHRSVEDVAVLADTDARIRLCKGAYAEPREVAFTTNEEISASYAVCAESLINGSGRPLFATHDPELIAEMVDLAHSSGRHQGSYEFQMLYGIRFDEQRRLAALGESVRVYVPFGSDWWGYFIRRLAERPANLVFFLRAMVGR